jgi:signal transduction histidine kinase
VRSILLASWLVALLALGGLALIVRAAAELAARRGKFVSAVSHELRTPLTTLSMYSQMLAEGMVVGEDARRVYARTLHEQSTRLSRIVESVLDFARLGREKPMPVRAVALSVVADRVEGIANELCKKAGRELSHDRAGVDEVRVRTDVAVVERIAANLVENACKYGTGTITMRWSISQSEPRSAQLLISDEGQGVPERESRRIFRAFERGSAHADGSTPGLGLGLAVSRELARRAGGDLRHTGGSRFALTLPMASG